MTKEWPTHCARCRASFSTIACCMSRFNLEHICITCEHDEREAPGYQRAFDAELAAVRNGNYNFPGIGLSSVDATFLANRRALRKTAPTTKR